MNSLSEILDLGIDQNTYGHPLPNEDSSDPQTIQLQPHHPPLGDEEILSESDQLNNVPHMPLPLPPPPLEDIPPIHSEIHSEIRPDMEGDLVGPPPQLPQVPMVLARPLPSEFELEHDRTCPVCKVVFEDRDDLAIHRRSHRNSYICSTCGKGMDTAGGLKAHMSTAHTKRAPYVRKKKKPKSVNDEPKEPKAPRQKPPREPPPPKAKVHPPAHHPVVQQQQHPPPQQLQHQQQQIHHPQPVQAHQSHHVGLGSHQSHQPHQSLLQPSHVPPHPPSHIPHQPTHLPHGGHQPAHHPHQPPAHQPIHQGQQPEQAHSPHMLYLPSSYQAMSHQPQHHQQHHHLPTHNMMSMQSYGHPSGPHELMGGIGMSSMNGTDPYLQEKPSNMINMYGTNRGKADNMGMYMDSSGVQNLAMGSHHGGIPHAHGHHLQGHYSRND